MIEIGKFIFLKRKQLKMTQAELAKKTELAQSTLSGLERGDSSPLFSVIERIINYGFEMSVIDFLNEFNSQNNTEFTDPSTFPSIENNLAKYEIEKNSISELNTLGEKLSFLRNFHNASQDKIASLLGITRSAYSTYERNIAKPSIKNMYILSNLFDVPLNSLTLDFNPIETNRIVDLSDFTKKDFTKIMDYINFLQHSTDINDNNLNIVNSPNEAYLNGLKKIDSIFIKYIVENLKISSNLTKYDITIIKNLFDHLNDKTNSK